MKAWVVMARKAKSMFMCRLIMVVWILDDNQIRGK